MAKKQRKRSGSVAASGKTQTRGTGSAQSRAQAGTQTRRSPVEPTRPKPPWGSFPLSELLVAVAFCLGIAGFLNAAGRGPVLLGLAVALGSLAGLELSLREHLAGFRSHSTVLAGCVSAVCIAATVLVFGTSSAARAAAVGFGICVFCAAFWAFRRLYSSRRARVRVR